MEQYLQLTLLNPSYRVFYADGVRFDSSPCIATMVREITHKISPSELPGYLRLMADLGRCSTVSCRNLCGVITIP